MPRTPNLYVRIWPSPTNPDSSIQQSVKPRMSISNHHCRRSVAQSCPTLCDPMDYSTPGFSVLHWLLEFVQIHIHWLSDAIQYLILYCPLLLLPSTFPSIRVFSNVLVLCISCQSIGASASVLPVNIQGWFPWGLKLLLHQGDLRGKYLCVYAIKIRIFSIYTCIFWVRQCIKGHTYLQT